MPSVSVGRGRGWRLFRNPKLNRLVATFWRRTRTVTLWMYMGRLDRNISPKLAIPGQRSIQFVSVKNRISPMRFLLLSDFIVSWDDPHRRLLDGTAARKRTLY